MIVIGVYWNYGRVYWVLEQLRVKIKERVCMKHLPNPTLAKLGIEMKSVKFGVKLSKTTKDRSKGLLKIKRYLRRLEIGLCPFQLANNFHSWSRVLKSFQRV